MTTHRQVRKGWNGLANRAQGEADKKNLGKNVTGLKAEVSSLNYQGNTQFCLVS